MPTRLKCAGSPAVAYCDDLSYDVPGKHNAQHSGYCDDNLVSHWNSSYDRFDLILVG
jgi:hypothetical protein